MLKCFHNQCLTHEFYYSFIYVLYICALKSTSCFNKLPELREAFFGVLELIFSVGVLLRGYLALYFLGHRLFALVFLHLKSYDLWEHFNLIMRIYIKCKLYTSHYMQQNSLFLQKKNQKVFFSNHY